MGKRGRGGTEGVVRQEGRTEGVSMIRGGAGGKWAAGERDEGEDDRDVHAQG